MSTIDDLLENAKSYPDAPDAKFRRSGLPERHLVIVACMDVRLHLTPLLGLQEGDAHILRNAGGIVTDDVLRSITASQHLLETTDVMVIQHTDCGLLKIDDSAFDDLMREHAGHRPAWSLRSIKDLEENVRESVRAIRESPFPRNVGEVRGFVFDVGTGELREVS